MGNFRPARTGEFQTGVDTPNSENSRPETPETTDFCSKLSPSVGAVCRFGAIFSTDYYMHCYTTEAGAARWHPSLRARRGSFRAANFVAEEGVVGARPSADVDERERHVWFAHKNRDSFTQELGCQSSDGSHQSDDARADRST